MPNPSHVHYQIWMDWVPIIYCTCPKSRHRLLLHPFAKTERLYEIPFMVKGISTFGNDSIFPTPDENCRYLQVQIAEKYRYKTSFSSHHCHYQFTREQLGLQIAQKLFQRVAYILLWRVGGVRTRIIRRHRNLFAIVWKNRPIRKDLVFLHDLTMVFKLKKRNFITNCLI